MNTNFNKDAMRKNMRKKFYITLEVTPLSGLFIQTTLINAMARLLSAVLVSFGKSFKIVPVSIKDKEGNEVMDKQLIQQEPTGDELGIVQ
jgi:hypothetical protein